MNSLKKSFFIFLPVAICSTLILLTAMWGVVYLQYINTEKIEAMEIAGAPITITIPIKFVSTSLTDLPGISICTKDGHRYSLRCIPEKDILWITMLRMGYVSVYTVRYEVTDKKIRDKLMDIWKNSSTGK